MQLDLNLRQHRYTPGPPEPFRLHSYGLWHAGVDGLQHAATDTMKLWAILWGVYMLPSFALIAHAQGLGDAQRGAQVFAQCKVCHSLETGKNMIGPSLYGLIGRKAGAVPGYAYSGAMKNSNVTWSDHTLSKYLSDPKGYIPGDKMPFTGLKDPTKLGDLVAYLNQATK